MKLWAGFI